MDIVIIQPNFLPWRGYFHLIQKSDIFVFYDDVQFDKNSWRNRNIIKTKQGKQWITVPVLQKNRFGQKINEVDIDNVNNGIWRKKIWSTIYHNYKQAKHFNKMSGFFEDLFSKGWNRLVDLNIYSTKAICDILGIRRKFYRSSELIITGDRISRLVNICRELGGKRYISGPSARDYIKSESEFLKNGIDLEFHQYVYPTYPQLHGHFIPDVSIVDLLFNCGKDSPAYIWDK
jgi:hypothetical protein